MSYLYKPSVDGAKAENSFSQHLKETVSGVPNAALLGFAPGFGAGCALAFSLETSQFFYAFVGMIALALFWLFLRKFTFAGFLFTLTLGAAFGLANVGFRPPPVKPASSLEKPLYNVEITGEIQEILRREYRTALIIKADHITDRNEEIVNLQKISVNFSDKSKADHFLPGDYIRVKAHLFPLPTALFPGDYDYAFFAQAKGVQSTGKMTSEIKTLSYNEHSLRKIEGVRAVVKEKIYRAVAKESDAGIITALLTGDRSGVETEIAETWKVAGIYHLISISGLHMTIVAGFGFFLFGSLIYAVPPLAVRVRPRKVAAVFCLLFTGLYTALAGFEAPAVRAFVMTAVIFTGILIDRKALSIHGLCVAYLVILCVSPAQLFDIGFNLSFAAVLGIFTGVKALSFVFSLQNKDRAALGWSKILRYVVGFLTINLCAGYAGAPLAAFAFNNTSVYSFFANLIAIPLSTFILMPALALGALTLPFDFSAYFFQIAALCIAPLNHSANFFANAPGASLPLPSPSIISLILFYIGLYLAVILRKNAWFVGGACIACACALYGLAQFPRELPLASGEGRIVRHDDKNLTIFLHQDSRFYLSDYTRERLRIKFGLPKSAEIFIEREQN